MDDFSEEKRRFYNKFIEAMTPENPTLYTVQQTSVPGSQRWYYWIENGIYDDSGNLMEILSIGN